MSDLKLVSVDSRPVPGINVKPWQAIEETFRLVFPFPQVFEVRILNTNRGTVSGYFDDPARAAVEVLNWDRKAPGIYATFNPVNPDLLARAHNRLIPYAKHTTADPDILRRRVLAFDFDPVRASGISSTDAEHEAAIARGWECEAFLHDLGFPSVLVSDSGNGGHVLLWIDLPNDTESLTLVKRCIQAVALWFSDNVVSVDLTVHNAARIWKIYGTHACKGDSTQDRPHRLAQILALPDDRNPAPRELLERLAAMAPEEPNVHARYKSSSTDAFDLSQWIAEHHLEIEGPYPWQNGNKWIFPVCPWNADHTNKSAYLLRFANGAIAAGCHHNGCQGKGWHELRDTVEPGWRERWGKTASNGGTPHQSSRQQDMIEINEDLKVKIRKTVLDGDVKGFDKKRVISDLIFKHLKEKGTLYRTRDYRLFFFANDERRLYDLEQRPFQHLLIDASGLSSTETFFHFAFDTLTAYVARHGKFAEVHTLAYYEPENSVLTISDGGGGIWRRETNGQWIHGGNGDNGTLFLTEPDATPWEPDFQENENQLSWLLNQINFHREPLSIAHQRTFLTVWLLHQFFPCLRRTRTIPAWLGPQGSGKSTTCRLIGRFLLGDSFDVAGIRKEREDAFVAAITNRVLHAIDNADTRVDWLEDALAKYATGELFRLRRLYTTNDEVTYRPRAMLMLTSRDPHFKRPDVSQRLLPFHLQEIDAYQDEPSIFSDLARRRNALWGDLLTELAEVQDSLPTSTAPKLKFRMADYAAFGWQVFHAQGRANEWTAALSLLDKAQMRFAAEGDGLILALSILLENTDSVGPLTIKELYGKLSDIAEANSVSIPKTAEWLGRKLTAQKRVIESELNVILKDEHGHQSKRWITLKKEKFS